MTHIIHDFNLYAPPEDFGFVVVATVDEVTAPFCRTEVKTWIDTLRNHRGGTVQLGQFQMNLSGAESDGLAQYVDAFIAETYRMA